MKHLKSFEAIKWYNNGKLEQEEDDFIDEIDTGVYPGSNEFFEKFPVGIRVRIDGWYDSSIVTGTVIDHEMHKGHGTIVLKGNRFHTFPMLVVKTDKRVVIPDYRSYEDTYTNTIKVNKLEYDERGENWLTII